MSSHCNMLHNTATHCNDDEAGPKIYRGVRSRKAQLVASHSPLASHPPVYFGLRATYVVRIVCCSALRCVAVCCGVLQCVAVCCSVLQCVAVCCGVLRCVAVCCSGLQCVAVCCGVLQRGAV